MFVATVAALSSCATVPPCPAKGGRSWREITTGHFVLDTDLDEDEALRMLRTLEETRSAMLIGVWPKAGPSERTRIYSLYSRSELASYLGPLIAAKLQYQEPFPVFVVIPEVGEGPGREARHELAHRLSQQIMPLQPPWFSEGVATFLETIHRDPEDETRLVLGDADLGQHDFFQHLAPSDLDELLGDIPTTSHEMWRFYATSWLLVHYLYNHRPEQFRDFQERIGHLQPGGTAFREAFPDLAAGGLRSVLRTYAHGGQYVITRLRVPWWNGEHVTRTLSDAEVHATRAFLRATGPDAEVQRPAIRSDLDEAIQSRSPPIDALALPFYMQTLKYPLSRGELAKRAVAAHPDHWMAWLMAADVAPLDSAERAQALRRALALAPTEPEVLLRTTRELARARRWDQVYGLSHKMLGLGAHHPDIWLIHLSALIETRQCEAARIWGAAVEEYLEPAKKRDVAAVRARPCQAPVEEPAGATITSSPE